jgi:hypothetical protein
MSAKLSKLSRKLLLKWAMKLNISDAPYYSPVPKGEEWGKLETGSDPLLPVAPSTAPSLLDLLKSKATQIYTEGNTLRIYLEAAGGEDDHGPQRQTPSKRHLLMKEAAREVVRAITEVADILNAIRKGDHSVDDLAAKAKSLWKLTQTLMAKEYSLEMEELERFHLYLEQFLGLLSSIVEYEDYKEF